MAWCPFAIHRPLSENHLQGGIVPRAVILHTAVSSAPSLFDFFQNNSDLESHFYVRDDGVIEQYMDTGIRADANKNANSFAVSIETQDGGQIVPWTSAQVDALVRLCDWLCTTHGIPRRQIPAWDSSGIGWHVQFGAPGPWTPVNKSCPGGPRIDQTRNTIIPRVAAGQIQGDDDLQADERNALLSIYAALFNKFDGTRQVATNPNQGDQSVITRLVELQVNLRALIGRPTADIDEKALAAALAPMLPDVLGQLSDEDVTRIARAAADEEDRRERERLAG